MNSPYTIEIRGTGPNHMQPSAVTDADRVATIAAQTLADNGHVIESARFTSEAHQDDILAELGTGATSPQPMTDNDLMWNVILPVMRILEMPVNNAQGSYNYTVKDLPAWAANVMRELKELRGGKA